MLKKQLKNMRAPGRLGKRVSISHDTPLDTSNKTVYDILIHVPALKNFVKSNKSELYFVKHWATSTVLRSTDESSSSTDAYSITPMAWKLHEHWRARTTYFNMLTADAGSDHYMCSYINIK